VRDTFGRVADVYTDPVSYINADSYEVAAQSVRIIDLRASLLEAGRLLEGAALDKYQFVRDGYLQRRRNLIYDGNPPREKDDEPIEDPEPKAGPESKPPAPEGNSDPKPESKEDKPSPAPDQPAPAPAR
jgi:phospholipid-binding lipoprotein MlaA